MLKKIRIWYLFSEVNSRSREGVHNSNIMAEQKYSLGITEGQSWYGLTHSKGVFIEQTIQTNKIRGFVAQIESFCGQLCMLCILELESQNIIWTNLKTT